MPPRRPGREKRRAPSHDVMIWQGVTMPLQAPIFHYLGHMLARQAWEQKARDDYIGTICADLPRYRMLPLNAFERIPLMNTVLMPKWTYRTRFLPNGAMFKVIGTMCLEFVSVAEGVERHKHDVYTSHCVLHVTLPLRIGRMGLHQMF